MQEQAQENKYVNEIGQKYNRVKVKEIADELRWSKTVSQHPPFNNWLKIKHFQWPCHLMTTVIS